jgi:hypothetical protein
VSTPAERERGRRAVAERLDEAAPATGGQAAILAAWFARPAAEARAQRLAARGTAGKPAA